MTSLSASNFVFEGVENERNSIEVGMGLKMIQGKNTQLGIDLSADVNGDHKAYVASAGWKYMW